MITELHISFVADEAGIYQFILFPSLHSTSSTVSVYVRKRLNVASKMEKKERSFLYAVLKN